MKKKDIRSFLFVVLSIIALSVFSIYFFSRWDLTSEKRYSISDNTKKMLKDLNEDTHVLIYLDGDLNSGFLRLKKATKELLDEFKVHAKKDFSYEFINPSAAISQEERNNKYAQLEARGLRASVVYDKDDEGKAIQKVVFPWIEIVYDADTIPVNLLKNNPRFSGSQNLNNSIESLEFELTDALRLKTIKDIKKIAFIEGHDEFETEFIHEASIALNRYFQIDRGRLGNDPSILDDYKAIIIAGPQTAFSEQEKFVIDQYIMKGGRVLWLLDGVRISMDSLSTQGSTPAIPLNVNLDDQLFKYGVRIVPVLLEDMQSIKIPMNVAREGDAPQFEAMPWYYSPLLLTSPEHPVTRNLMEVKADFASALDLSVSENPKINKRVLLVTSNATHATMTPAQIDLNTMYDMDSKTYFTRGYIPVAVALEGEFSSVFTNRLVPQGIVGNQKITTESKPTRMIVIADADIIRNDVQGYGQNAQILPLGLDRYTGQEYGNKKFILNAMLYLADDDGWLQLRAREFKLRLLNKKEVVAGKKMWQIINVVLPLILLLIFALVYTILRKRHYSK